MYWLDYKSQSHLTIVKIDVIEAIIEKKTCTIETGIEIRYKCLYGDMTATVTANPKRNILYSMKRTMLIRNRKENEHKTTSRAQYVDATTKKQAKAKKGKRRRTSKKKRKTSKIFHPREKRDTTLRHSYIFWCASIKITFKEFTARTYKSTSEKNNNTNEKKNRTRFVC